MPHSPLDLLCALFFFAAAVLIFWKGPKVPTPGISKWFPTQGTALGGFIAVMVGVLVLQTGVGRLLVLGGSALGIGCLIVGVGGMCVTFYSLTKFLDKEMEEARVLFWVGMGMMMGGWGIFYLFMPH